MELVIISGMARVGKTVLANLLAKESFELGFKPIILPFAAPLKDEAERRGYTKEETPGAYREFCQVHGALKREEDPDYWVRAFEDRLIEIYEEELKDLKDGKAYWQRVVIADDCRYDNEISIAKKHRACTIFVSPGNRKIEDMNGEWRQHHSEHMASAIENGDDDLLSLFDYVINNDGDKEDLSEKVSSMAPIWTGVQASPNYNNEEMGIVISELVDLFLDEFGKIEEEEDDDQDYYCSD